MSTEHSTQRRTGAEKALFIPLKAEFYDAFAAGTKDTEYRLEGPRWNKRTCYEGRPVILSRGYGKKHRIKGRIAGVFYDHLPHRNIPGWSKCYPGKVGWSAICIRIELNR